MSSHIFEEVERTCDRTAIIRQGRIVDTVEMTALSKIRNQIYTVTLADGGKAKQLCEVPQFNVQSQNGNVVKLLVNTNIADTLKIIADFEPLDLRVDKQSLEDVFLHYYGNKEARKND